MADQRDGGISWTDETWNVVRGCTRVSAGCENCYAERVAAFRLSGEGQPYEGLARVTEQGEPRWTGKVVLVPELLDRPLRWQRPRRIFVNAMSDLFHERLPVVDIVQVFAAMALSGSYMRWGNIRGHTFQVLTKRAERMSDVLLQRDFVTMLCGAIEDLVRAHPTTRATRGPWPGMLVEALQRRDPGVWPLPSVWLGVSAEDQATLDARAPFLMRTPAALRWLSAEPLLGRIDARRWFGKELEASVSSLWLRGFDWVVAGGESAQPWEKARPTHPEWGTFLQAQCAEYGVPFLWKQWGEWAPVTRNAASRVAHRHDPRWHNWPDVGDESPVSLLVGRDKAGDLLNGQRWQQFPVAA